MKGSFNNPMLEDPFDASLPDNPYPGLRSFYSSEWPIFFGRETMIDEIIELLVKNNFILIHGDSGCGKSSVIRAGVLVQLQQGYLADGKTWRTCAIVPRNAPLRGLAEALARLNTPEPSESDILDIRKILDHGKLAPVLLSSWLLKDENDSICILVDQFEELFRFAREHSAEEAQAFIDVLTGIATSSPSGIFAILTMRSEFLGSCSRFSGLAETINHTQYLLPRMGNDALRRTIQEPARLYGGEIKKDLTEKLIENVKGNQDELPLIQHGLRQLWYRPKKTNGPHASNVVLDLMDFEQAESLEKLLDDHASAILDKLIGKNEKLTTLVEYVFRSLTDINADGQAIRRPLTFDRLKQETGSEEEALREVIEAFRAEGANFIFPFGSNKIEGRTMIDISHEAFIRSWSKLSDPKEGWLWKEFNDGLAWRALRFQSARFVDNKKDQLSLAGLSERAKWISSLPSPTWCERYGNENYLVIKLFGISNYRWSIVGSLTFAVPFLFYFSNALSGLIEELLLKDWQVVFDNIVFSIIEIISIVLLLGWPFGIFTWRWIQGSRTRSKVEKFFKRKDSS